MGLLRRTSDSRQPDGWAGYRRSPLSAGAAAAGENDPHQQGQGATTLINMSGDNTRIDT